MSEAYGEGYLARCVEVSVGALESGISVRGAVLIPALKQKQYKIRPRFGKTYGIHVSS